MRALVLDVVFSLDLSGRFSLTRLGRRLRVDAPASMHPWVVYWSSESNCGAWAELDRVVSTGEPAFSAVHGMSVWRWCTEHPDESRVFADALRRITEIDLPEIVGLYPWPQTGTLCDIAGGAGTLLSGVLSARRQLRGVLVEPPLVLGEAERLLSERGMRNRVDLVAGDLFGVIDAKADIYSLKNVLHDRDDHTCANILARLRSTVPAGATLVIVELLQGRSAAAFPASLIDLQMAGLRPGTGAVRRRDPRAVGLRRVHSHHRPYRRHRRRPRRRYRLTADVGSQW